MTNKKQQQGFAPIIILFIILLILFTIVVFVLIRKNTNSKTNPQVSYECPKEEWVNCMPGTVGSPNLTKLVTPPTIQPYSVCSQDFLNWAKVNCPNFKGAAY